MFNLRTVSLAILSGILLGVLLYQSPNTLAQLRVLTPDQGGTGVGTRPTLGQILVGNSTGSYDLTATTSLGLSVLPHYASTTIGNGTQDGGLTINGGATTTGTSNLGVVTGMRVGQNPTRPLINNQDTTLTVCSSGCDYTTIQGAVNQIPIFINYDFRIEIGAGTYNEDIIVPWIAESRINPTEGDESVGLVIVGSTTAPTSVRVSSFFFDGGVSTITQLNGVSITGVNPYDNESAAIGVYGLQEIEFNNITFEENNGTADRGIVCYSSRCKLVKTNFGNLDLNKYGVHVKHSGWATENNTGVDYGTTGTVGEYAYFAGDGIIFYLGDGSDSTGLLGRGDLNHGILVDVENGPFFGPEIHFTNFDRLNATTTAEAEMAFLVGDSTGNLRRLYAGVRNDAATSTGIYFHDENSTTTDRYAAIFVNKVERARFDANGDLNIGTTSPSTNTTLFVQDTVANQLTLYRPTTSNIGMEFRNNMGSWYLGQGSGGNLNIDLDENLGDAPLFTLTASGNLGIGTTSPYAKLSVVGDVVASAFHATTTATSTFGGGIDLASGCFAISGVCLSGADGTFSTTSASYFLSQNQGNAFSTTSANHFVNASSTIWNDTTEASLEAFLTDVTNVFTNNDGTLADDDLTNNSIEDLSDVAAITENFGDLFYWNGSAWADIATSSLNINTDNLMEGSSNLFSQWDNISGGINYAGGNVAVGTTTPLAKLHVKGDDGASTRGLVVDSDGESDDVPFQVRVGDIATPLADSNEVFRVDDTGFVGVNTASPLALVHSESESNSFNYVARRGSVSNGEYASIGLGVTTAATLQAIKGAIIYERNGSNGLGALHLALNTANDTSNASLNDTKITIQNTGNVGIGTTSPYAKLSVAGDVVMGTFHATNTAATSTVSGNLEVDGTLLVGGVAVPDYIFDYWLTGKVLPVDEDKEITLNIDQIRAFVDEEHHLPFVDGRDSWTGKYNVATIVAQLWESIEVAWITLFDHEDRLDENEQRIQEQEQRIRQLEEQVQALIAAK